MRIGLTVGQARIEAKKFREISGYRPFAPFGISGGLGPKTAQLVWAVEQNQWGFALELFEEMVQDSIREAVEDYGTSLADAKEFFKQHILSEYPEYMVI